MHAHGQVITFDARADGLDLPALWRALNKLLGPAIAVHGAAIVADDFDARHSATARSYRYRIWNRPVHDPLIAATTWPLPRARAELGAALWFGVAAFNIAVTFWIGEETLAWSSVGIALPLLAVSVPRMIAREREDPAP